MAREQLLDNDSKGDKVDANAFEAGDDESYSFQANYEMLQNIFRTGVSPGQMMFRGKKVFPYELDKFQKPIRSFKITKVFDSQSKKFKTEQDLEKEAERVTNASQLRKQ